MGGKGILRWDGICRVEQRYPCSARHKKAVSINAAALPSKDTQLFDQVFFNPDQAFHLLNQNFSFLITTQMTVLPFFVTMPPLELHNTFGSAGSFHPHVRLQGPPQIQTEVQRSSRLLCGFLVSAARLVTPVQAPVPSSRRSQARG